MKLTALSPADGALWVGHLTLGAGHRFCVVWGAKASARLSPAEELVRHTTFFVNLDWFLIVLALGEMVIGLGLITGKSMRLTLLLLFLQMGGKAVPLLILPATVWTVFPYGLTLEGQYIMKNLVLIGAGLGLGGTVCGGRLEPEPTAEVKWVAWPSPQPTQTVTKKSGSSSTLGEDFSNQALLFCLAEKVLALFYFIGEFCPEYHLNVSLVIFVPIISKMSRSCILQGARPGPMS